MAADGPDRGWRDSDTAGVVDRLRRALWRRLRWQDVLALGVAAIAGLAVFVVAREVFPYLSVNDDEGVYLLQASMLLEGQLNLYPGRLAPSVRPWFFVVADAPDAAGGVRMYAKYTPPTAALFALSKAVTGAWDPVLAVVAAWIAVAVYGLTTAGFDRTTGVVAVAALLGTPLFLITTATHLSYAPATALNLAFAVAYVRAARVDAAGSPHRAVGWAAVAGMAVGLAFFTRPYTAVLFASPFVVHALVTLREGVARGRVAFQRTLARLGTVAVLGLLWVGVALAYNAALTGDPLVFPYQEFAPRDGIGFGTHEILGYERAYTPPLAAETTVRLLALFARAWSFAGPIGAALALVGGAYVFVRGRTEWADDRPRAGDLGVPGCPPRTVRQLLAGVAVAVVLGEAYFWGTLNGLNNRLIHLLGPFYHYDLLLPLSAFGAAGVVGGGRELARQLRTRLRPRRLRIVAVVVLVVAVPVVGAAEVAVVGGAVGPNADRTDNLAATYEPFTERDLAHAVVFTPDPYGDWQQHPFQFLRNDPGFDGDVVYVLDEGPDRDWVSLNATGNRTPYRFTYRGEWTAATGEHVVPRLVELDVLAGDRVNATSRLGVPTRASSVSVRLETELGSVRYEVDDVPESGPLVVDWTVGPDGARVTGVPSASEADATVPLPDGGSEVDLVVTFVTPTGTSVTYRQEATVHVADDRVKVIWPPETRVCHLTTACGRDHTWVGDRGEYLSGVSVETDAEAVDVEE